MYDLEAIIKTARIDQWPYPKTFEMLKRAGVASYTVHFTDEYNATYLGSFGTWKEATPSGYKRLQTAKQFSEEGVKASLSRHIENQTTYSQLLAELAENGVSHYKVEIAERTVTYFSDDEMQFHQQNVPQWM